MGLQQTVLDAVKTAEGALGDLIVDMTIVSRTQNTYAPGQSASYNESSSPVKAVISKYKDHEVDGEMIHKSDLLVMVFPQPNRAIPKPNDVLRFGDREWRIIANSPIYAGSEIALHMVQVRPPI